MSESLKIQILSQCSKEQAKILANRALVDLDLYREIIDLFLTENYRLNQRVFWIIYYVHHSQPGLLIEQLHKIIHHLQKPKLHNAIKRNSMRLLQEITIPKEHWGPILDKAFEYLADANEAIAVRVFSMTVIWNIVQNIPELIPELKIILEQHYEYGSKGFKSRARKTLKAIEKMGY